MKILSCKQGENAWHIARANSRTASEAPSVMGASKYLTRSALMQQKSLGTVVDAEIDEFKQALFDRGHRAEAAAREVIETMIGEDLFPIVCTTDDGRLLASLDGATMDGDTGFECKLMNGSVRAQVEAKSLEPHYFWQLEQQIYVAGLEKVIFVASNEDGTDLVWMEYRPVPGRIEQLLAAWDNFDIDLATYTPVEAALVAVATPTLGLPAVSIQVNGSIALIDNLGVFGNALTAYIANLNLKPETDQDFADLDGAVKTFKKAEDALEAAENGALAQTASIDTMRRTVAQYKELARVNRLMAEKLVKTEKDNRRIAIVTKARTAFDAHVAGLNASLGKPYMPQIAADFATVVKGLKTITSIQNAVDTELARVKIEADATANRIRANLSTLRELASAHAFLFADTAQIVLKAPDDCAALVKTRIAEHQAAELAKEEATRERIRAEEQAKAEKDARDKLAREAEDLRLASEATARADAAAELAAAKQLPEGVELSPAAQALNEQEGAARFAASHPKAANVVPITRAAPAPQAAPATPPTLKLGDINALLSPVNLTADGLTKLGFPPAATDKSAKLYHARDLTRICAALHDLLDQVQAKQAA